MKHILQAIILSAVILTIAGCEQFSTSYERVDDSEFRVLHFEYTPADIAPGRILTIRASFAGKEVDLAEHLEWWVSFNMIRDIFGAETIVDSVRLEPLMISREFIDRHTKTQYMIIPPPVVMYEQYPINRQDFIFSFRIPEDIVRKSAAIPERWTDMLPPYMVNAMPPEFAAMTKNEIIDALERLAVVSRNGCPIWLGELGNLKAFLDPANKKFIPLLLQYFTVPIRISARVRNTEPGRLPHTIWSSHSVRYNSIIGCPEGIPVNDNPHIYYAFISKIEGENATRDDQWHSVIYLDNSGYAEIPVERGYSYFITTFLTYYPDESITMAGNRVDETYSIYRMFMLDKEETRGVCHTRFMSIDNGNGRITMPSDPRITKFTIWIKVTDEVMNERLRPQGSAMREFSGRFVYR